LRDGSLYLEAGLARRKEIAARDRERIGFHARLHWGKLFTTSPSELKGVYKKMPEFIELSTQYDPRGKFRNEYLNKNIFGN
jgi:xylitol oxidase